MFAYQDPTGRDFLDDPAVAVAFRHRMQDFYERFARRQQSAFTWLEAFDHLADGPAPAEAHVTWPAFPLSAVASDAEIDGDRLGFQDEYVEWHVVRDQGGRVRSVTFTTEFPEYFEAYAEVSGVALTAAVRDAIPGADPTVVDLFGPGGDPDALPALARRNRFRARLRQNPWNSGAKGILSLVQQFNTLNALFHLVTECGVRRSSGTPDQTCAAVGGACGPNRNSDPRVCIVAQRAVRNEQAFTLRDPAGVRIVRLDGVWKVNGQAIDVNDPAANRGVWQVTRRGRRGVLTVIDGLTLDDGSVVTGTDVSRRLEVAANLVVAPENRLPAWARLGLEAESRGPAPEP